MTPDRPNRVPEIRRALTNVKLVCDSLGLTAEGGKTVQRQAGGGLLLRCVWHADRTPSMSVRLGDDGTIAVKCHACGVGADVLGLIAEVRGLSTKTQFRAVLVEAAKLAGLWAIVDELEGRDCSAGTGPRTRPQAPDVPLDPPSVSEAVQAPPRDYPPIGEVEGLWGACRPVSDDPAVAGYLAGRAIDPDAVESRDLARVLPFAGWLPSWARCRGGSWRDAWFRLILPMFDPMGVMRTVRAWRVGGDPDLPKRLPPSGHKASGVVLADEWARLMLCGVRKPRRVVVTEGEPDMCVWSCRVKDPHTAVIGVVSGSWTRELAQRFPIGIRVDVRTDNDAAGDRYAAEIFEGLRRRCFVYRSTEVT